VRNRFHRQIRRGEQLGEIAHAPPGDVVHERMAQRLAAA
jgi:hypothetical protein